MTLLENLRDLLGETHVLTGSDMERYATDWTGIYHGAPLAVLRPATTQDVSAIVRAAADSGTPIVPVGGNTGLCGGTHAEGAVMISLERMNAIREIRTDSRIAIVEAGVVLDSLHRAAGEHGLIFPLTFGARGSAMLGGCLSTNAGGSNVVRYGSTRALCLGLEVVLASGEVLDLMTALHKDNSGYDLKDLFIGAEGTLGIITAATLKLFPKPAAYATAMVAVSSLSEALTLLNRLQEATGGAVEAYEYMPRRTLEALVAHFPKLRAPFAESHEVNLLVEIGATAPADAEMDETGTLPVVAKLEAILADMLEEEAVLDAVVAQNEAQRAGMWAMREGNAEVALAHPPFVNTDICLPLHHVETFLDRIEPALKAIDPGVTALVVAHLGDGNIHYTAQPSRDDADLLDRILEEVEALAMSFGGSFSAEHGIGKSKLNSMRRRKPPAALAVMRQIKTALDPQGILNPGKVLP